jgi:hypothetical protein
MSVSGIMKFLRLSNDWFKSLGRNNHTPEQDLYPDATTNVIQSLSLRKAIKW